MKRWRLIPAAGLLFAALAAGGRAPATHTWANHHWARTANPFVLTYKANVAVKAAVWGPLVNKVIGEWGNVHQYKPGTYDVLNWESVAGAEKVTIDIADFGATGWFGTSTIDLTATGHITGAQIQVNEFYFKGPYNTRSARDHVLCQEVGRALGLDANRFPLLFGASCMNDDTSTLNLHEYRTPNYHDAEQLASTYGHADEGNSGGGYPGPLKIIHIWPAR